MSAPERHVSVWRVPALVFVTLLLLLAASATAAYLPLGRIKTAASLVIAGIKALLVGLVFMRLNRSSALVRIAAGAGFLWVVFLFALTGADVMARL